MYIVIYSFEVKPNRIKAFLSMWKELTIAIHKNCNSLGSRLHKDTDGKFLAYAQWPDKETFNNSTLPSEYKELRVQLKDACRKIEVLKRIEMIEDLLVSK